MTNQKTIYIFLIFLYTLSSHFVFAQNDIPLKTLVERKQELSFNYPNEDVYLHFDKPYYAVGDTIWFKAYLNIQQHLPSPLSKILYVELINKKDSLIETLKIPVKNSVADGSLLLPYPEFKEGNYHVRAYTKWMLNFNQAYFFKKNIYVGNALNKNLTTNITFKGTVTDKEQKVNTKILFKDDRGKPIANKKVSWEVYADYDRVARGKETTDDNGYLNIEFSASTKVDINRGKLLTSLDNGDKRLFNSTFPLKTAILENDIQFFPEGGDFSEGLNQKIAFKAITSNGLGTDVKGEIVDEAGKKIIGFSSQHLGMGSFSITPESGKKYFANVVFADNSKKKVALPEVKAESISLSVEQIADSLEITVNATREYLLKNRNQVFYLVAQNGGVFYYAAQSVLRVSNFKTKIPSNQFPTGVLQVALLKTNGLTMSQRLVFIQRDDDTKIKIKTDLPNYVGRQKIKMSIKTEGGLSPAEGSYSVSVVNDSKVPIDQDKEITIKSNYLLTTDLIGYIEQPNYYFNNPNKQKFSDLDALMLTQGYTRFSYKDLAEDVKPVIATLPEQNIAVSGMIRRSNGMPLTNGRLLLQIPDKYFNKDGTTDAEGKFKFDNLIFKDSSEVVINARNNINSKDIKIVVDGEMYPSMYTNINSPDYILNMDSVLNTYLKSSKMEHQSAFMLREVVVTSQAVKKEPSHSDYSALSGLGMIADRTIPGSQFSNCTRLVDCMSAAGLTYEDQRLYLTRNFNQGSKVPVEIYANGMPVDVNYLFSIDAKGIFSIEVFNNDGVSGINRNSNTSGVLVINMKEIPKGTSINKAQLADLFPPTNVLTYKPKGYSVERQFYVPKFSGPRTNFQSEDYRTTIYWNPFLNTDKEGNASFEFYNSDAKGPYRVTIEGVDKNGNIAREVFTYQLK